MMTTEARQRDARRNALADPVVGMITQAQGGRRVLRRGLEPGRAAWDRLAAPFTLRILAAV